MSSRRAPSASRICCCCWSRSARRRVISARASERSVRRPGSPGSGAGSARCWAYCWLRALVMASRRPGAWTSQVDTLAGRATAANVVGVPTASIRSIVASTRARLASLSRRRAPIMPAVRAEAVTPSLAVPGVVGGVRHGQGQQGTVTGQIPVGVLVGVAVAAEACGAAGTHLAQRRCWPVRPRHVRRRAATGPLVRMASATWVNAVAWSARLRTTNSSASIASAVSRSAFSAVMCSSIVGR